MGAHCVGQTMYTSDDVNAEPPLHNMVPLARFYMVPSSIGDLHMLTKEIK